MAELVDALDSKSGIRKDVQVRFLFGAPENQGVIEAAAMRPFSLLQQYYNILAVPILM
jgi:hypothetical protein